MTKVIPLATQAENQAFSLPGPQAFAAPPSLDLRTPPGGTGVGTEASMISMGCGLEIDDLSSVRKAVERLVDDLIALECEVVAVGRGYCITPPDGREVRVKAVLDAFGPRDHLLDVFNEALRLRGLVIEI